RETHTSIPSFVAHNSPSPTTASHGGKHLPNPLAPRAAPKDEPKVVNESKANGNQIENSSQFAHVTLFHS
uniref:Uncharacterized protein n=1 Tax=Anopheles atroparvus TaxID=41427 RepID=A0AAG5CWE7_ANOAO